MQLSATIYNFIYLSPVVSVPVWAGGAVLPPAVVVVAVVVVVAAVVVAGQGSGGVEAVVEQHADDEDLGGDGEQVQGGLLAQQRVEGGEVIG